MSELVMLAGTFNTSEGSLHPGEVGADVFALAGAIGLGGRLQR